MKLLLLLISAVIMTAGSAFAQTPGVSLEEFTGAWCGYCPYGAQVLDSIQSRLGDRAVTLAWHFDDKLEIRAHDTLAKLISNGGHPVVSVNRKPVIGGPLEFSEEHPWYKKALEIFEIDPAATPALNYIQYDPSSRALVFMPTLTPVIPDWPYTGVPMSVAILTQDDVPLDQTLYEKDGKPLPKLLDYPHQNVVRQIAGSVLGDSMNYAFGAGWFFLPYSMTVSEKWDASKTRLNVLFVVRNEDGSYTSLRALKTRYLTELNTMHAARTTDATISVYPNPASERLTLDLPANAIATIELHNALGQLVLTQRAQGNTSLDVRHLPRGMYSLTINSKGALSHTRLILH